MRLLNLSDFHINSPYGHGGQATVSHQLAKHLSRNHELLSVTAHWPGAPRKQVIDRVDYMHVGWGPNRVMSRLSYAARAAQIARFGHYDIVVDHVDVYAPTFAVKVAKCPVVLVVHNDFFQSVRKRRLLAPAASFLLRYQYRHCRYMVTVSKGASKSIADCLSRIKALEVIPNGIDEKLLSLPTRADDFLLFLGRIDTHGKGLDLLVEAMELVRSDVNLVIAGDGHDAETIRRMIVEAGLSDRIDMVGWVVGEQKTGLLTTCLAVVMPSRYEGWGIVATEAAACGKPVIGTRVVGLEEAVIDGQTGILVAPDDTLALAKAIDTVVYDEALRRRLGEAAREHAQAHTWDHIASRYEAFFERIMGGADS